MIYKITESKPREEISIQEAIEKDHIIGFICLDDNDRYLIVKVAELKYAFIEHKRVACVEYFCNKIDTLQNMVEIIQGNENYKITNSFDNYEDAFKWYLGLI